MISLTTIQYFIFWSFIWVIVLNYPTSSTEVTSAYRLNLSHGLICSIVAISYIFNILNYQYYFDERFTCMASISYFIVDFINIILNDHIWKVKYYQTPFGRKMEYLHHLLCGGFAIASGMYYNSICTFDQDPFLQFMFAETSTTILMIWRYQSLKSLYIGILFAISFFIIRIIYHGLYLVPECYLKCNKVVALGFGIPYNLMNIFFMFTIVTKLISMATKKDKNK